MEKQLKEVSAIVTKTLQEDHSPAEKLAFLLSLAAATREIAFDTLDADNTDLGKVKQLYELADMGLDKLLEA